MFDSTKNVGLCFHHSDTDGWKNWWHEADLSILLSKVQSIPPEFMFELPHKTFLNDIIIDRNDVTYHGAKLMTFDAAKQSL